MLWYNMTAYDLAQHIESHDILYEMLYKGIYDE